MLLEMCWSYVQCPQLPFSICIKKRVAAVALQVPYCSGSGSISALIAYSMPCKLLRNELHFCYEPYLALVYWTPPLSLLVFTIYTQCCVPQVTGDFKVILCQHSRLQLASCIVIHCGPHNFNCLLTITIIEDLQWMVTPPHREHCMSAYFHTSNDIDIRHNLNSQVHACIRAHTHHCKKKVFVVV